MDELIQLMLQRKVLREEKESMGKGWRAPRRLREAANADKLRNGSITLTELHNQSFQKLPEQRLYAHLPPATEGEAQDVPTMEHLEAVVRWFTLSL